MHTRNTAQYERYQEHLAQWEEEQRRLDLEDREIDEYNQKVQEDYEADLAAWEAEQLLADLEEQQEAKEQEEPDAAVQEQQAEVEAIRSRIVLLTAELELERTKLLGTGGLVVRTQATKPRSGRMRKLYPEKPALKIKMERMHRPMPPEPCGSHIGPDGQPDWT